MDEPAPVPPAEGPHLILQLRPRWTMTRRQSRRCGMQHVRCVNPCPGEALGECINSRDDKEIVSANATGSFRHHIDRTRLKVRVLYANAICLASEANHSF